MAKLPTIESGNGKRPSISLAMIVKNESHNLPRLLKSVEGCFDEIIIVDTGSTDDTKEIAHNHQCQVFDFEWVNSFCKARNFAFSKVTTDYVMWLDADDVLHNKDNFIKWRDHAMQYAEFWFATYDYAVDKDLNPVISFVRERVMKMSINPTWQYDLHEGVVAGPEWSRNYATPWSVKHLRSAEDIAADKSRNITILEQIVESGKADARMQYYYSKELYEASRARDAVPAFDKCLKMEGLEHHDRVLALQYAGYAAMGCFDQLKPEFTSERNHYVGKALDYAHQGIKIEPNRAEFFVLAADTYIRTGQIDRAVPYFSAAKACLKNFKSPYEGAIYSFKDLYGQAPSVQLAKVYAHLGMLDKAKKEATECFELYKNPEAKAILVEVDRLQDLTNLDNNQQPVEDILITTPPQTAYEFDEEIYKTKGMGGSETALIEMAKLLKQKTGRPVKVFSMRKESLRADSGVEYIPNSQLSTYLSKYRPHVHIAWRHNIKLTNAPTYLWCHDLFTPGVESGHNFDKILCLSDFHRDYVGGLQGVPSDKIITTRNGIRPEKFQFQRKVKDPNKFVWMSSPDRGLDRAMLVMDEVRREFPHAELHVYYGIEGLFKYGPQMAALAMKLQDMMKARPWVKYHGFTEQSKMYEDVSDAVIWCHPCNFIETFCITALEMLALGVFPVTRRLGALQNTLAEAEENRQAILLDHDCVTDAEIKQYANACCRVLLNRQWENIRFDLDKHSWASIADEWIETMDLEKPLDIVSQDFLAQAEKELIDTAAVGPI